MSNVHGEAAVLVLAAGASTRMRSDTPKVLHTLAGRSMLAHALHSVAKAAPGQLVVLLGHDRDRIAPAVAELADELGRPIQVAVQEEQLGTGHAVRCALPALPEDYTGIVVVTYGDVPLLDADTLAGLIAAHSAESAAVTVLTTTLPDPTGYGRIVRTADGEVIGDRRAGRRQPGGAGHPRDQRRRLRVRCRGAALCGEPAAAPQRPAGALPDRRDLDRPVRWAGRAGQARR